MSRRPAHRILRALAAALLSALGGSPEVAEAAQPLPAFDFTQAAVGARWGAAHDIASLTPSPEGLVAKIVGADPYFSGPPTNFPGGQPLWLRLKLKSDAGGVCQVFYFTDGPQESQSIRFQASAGQWMEGRLALPALGPGFRFRIDPPGTDGLCVLASLRFEARGPLPDFDFTTFPDVAEWGNPHDLSVLPSGTNGLTLQITGPDPYLFGPPRDYPLGQNLWMNMRLRSDQSGGAQLFFFTTAPSEEQSVHFTAPGGKWSDIRVPLPALGPGVRLRLDPPGSGGTCVVARAWFELRPSIPEPSWQKPIAPDFTGKSASVVSGPLRMRHSDASWGAFEIQVNDTRFAIGQSRSLLGYFSGATPRWMLLNNAAALSQGDGSVDVTCVATDPDGGVWTLAQHWASGPTPGVLQVETRIRSSADRSVIFLPALNLFSGVGAFGGNKTQALMAGLEYLENEPSSSEADVIGPGARRQVPDQLKLTMPLMALAANDRYLGLSWEPQLDLAPLHDTPDRIFGSGGSVMGLILPGSDISARADGSVLPYGGLTLRSNTDFVVKAQVFGGSGATVIPAVRQYVETRGLPPLPSSGYTAQAYYRLAAGGWLDSQIRDGAQFRHAVGANFGSQPVADAPLFMDWLSRKTDSPSLSNRLAALSRDALSLVNPSDYNAAAIGHVRSPSQALVFGGVAENADAALARGQARLAMFQPNGAVLYQAPPGQLDLGKTHWSKEANGLAAPHVVYVLEQSLFSGDAPLLNEGLRLLRALSKFRNTVPRGAQTWEVPLHTPDILASAYLLRAFTLGYEATGDPDFLEQARYWAWTGVPFVYLSSPLIRDPAGPVGVYSTTPVFGATGFVAPLWIGLPVQWCGLVYADALLRFARYDPQGPWITLARGIALAGLQHTHPSSEPAYQGLLPDSFDLRGQIRNPVPINPGTLQSQAIPLFSDSPVYDFRAFPHHGVFAHAPGLMTDFEETRDLLRFKAQGWPSRSWRVLITGLKDRPKLRLNGRDIPIASPHQYQQQQGRLILQLGAPTTIELQLPAKDALRIETIAPGRQVRVSWPTNASDYVLEQALRLADFSEWNPIEQGIARDGVENLLILTPGAQQGFFRLRRHYSE
ncbi:MAG: hypothetical protein HYR88_02390 [Verrucomicrobia bacterium]|nr:hypothetical protein [Verrucomicrobiota bacterium]